MWEESRKWKSGKGGQAIRERSTSQSSWCTVTGGQARVFKEIWEAKHIWLLKWGHRKGACSMFMKPLHLCSFHLCGVQQRIWWGAEVAFDQ